MRVGDAAPVHSHTVQRDGLVASTHRAHLRVRLRRSYSLVQEYALRALARVVHDEQRVDRAVGWIGREIRALVRQGEAWPAVGDGDRALLRVAGDAGWERAGQPPRGFGEDEGLQPQLILDEGGPDELCHAAGGRVGPIAAAARN